MNENRSTFVKQATILAAAGIISRIIGFFYRPPLTALIGDAGMGIYSIGHQIYNFLIILSSAGLPVAISKMISERLAVRDVSGAHGVFRVALYAAAIAGAFCSILILLFAGQITAFMGNPDSRAALLVLSPTVTIVAVMAVYRGYFQGMGSTLPTAISQVLEQIFNAVFSVFLAWYFMNTVGDIVYGAAGGTAGTGIGAAVGLIVMLIIYRLNLPLFKRRLARDGAKKTDYKPILKELLLTALPIIAGTAIFSFTNLIDSAMVMHRLQGYLSEEESLVLYGQLANKYVSISTLPVSISSAIAVASIPSVATSRILAKSRELSAKINTAMRLSMLISFPAAVGIGVFARQILLFLFPSYPGGEELVRVGAISIVFLALYQISTGMLQGLDKIRIPMISVICGVLVKIPLNYYLLGIPEINVQGTVISTIVCYVIASLVNIVLLVRLTGIRLDFWGILIKPAFASFVMGMFCYVVYYLLYFVYPRNTICLLIAMFAGVLCYFACMTVIRGLKAADIILMPFGEKLIYLIRLLGFGGFLKKDGTNK